MSMPVLDMISYSKRDTFGRYRRNRAKIERLIAQDPQVEYYMELAYLEARTQHWENAQKAIEQALALDPSRGEAQLFLAQLLEIQERHEEARSIYLSLLENHPFMSVAYREFGRFLLEQGSLSLAQSMLLKGLEINPRDALAHTLLAEIYLQKDRRAQALLHLEIANRFHENEPFFHQCSAQIFMQLEEYDKAAKHFKLALQVNRKNKSLRSLLREAVKKKQRKSPSSHHRFMIWKRWGW